MTNHTPGPWRFHSETGFIGSDHGYVPIATPFQETWQTGKPQAVANARLIAAAPDLLAALEALTDPEGHIYHGRYPDGPCTGECQAVRAAILKATGEAQ
jgi:hypothetical protein